MGGIVIDQECGQFVCDFVERLPTTDTGKPFVLHPWQRDAIMEFYSTLEPFDEVGHGAEALVRKYQYPMAAGRAVERLDMAQTGQIALPGLKSLFMGTLEFMLPAQSYPFLTSGAVAQPSHYLGQLTEWSAAANVCRYIVTGTDINVPVLLGALDYGENDGTNDVNCKLPLYEYRYLDEAQAEKVTQNNGRPVDTTSQPETAGSYTVVKGDSLWAICKKNYGDGSLAYKLATANSIKNPNLIYPGQVLTLPDKAVLAGYAATPAPTLGGTAKQSVGPTTTQVQSEREYYGMTLKQWKEFQKDQLLLN